MKAFRTMLGDTTAASAAEYALILAIVGGAIALSSVALGTSISASMISVGKCVSNLNIC